MTHQIMTGFLLIYHLASCLILLIMWSFAAYLVTAVSLEHGRHWGLLSGAISLLVFYAMLFRMITGRNLGPDITPALMLQLIGVGTLIRLGIPMFKKQLELLREFGWSYAVWLLFLAAIWAGSYVHPH